MPLPSLAGSGLVAYNQECERTAERKTQISQLPFRFVPGADVIEIRGLRAVGLIGANPEEQERAQPFEIDLEVRADLSTAGQSDVLADTINYGDVIAAAACVVETERHQLLERVAQRIADDVLAVDPRATHVTVTVRKLRPPVPFDVATAGVTVTRSRA